MYYITDKNEAIRESKGFLYYLSQTGYPQLPRTTVDIYYDDETVLAVKEFQSIMDLPITGEIDYGTHTALYNEYVFFKNDFESRDYIISNEGFPIEPGAISEDVRVLNAMLNEIAKYYSGIEKVENGSYYSEKSAETVAVLRKIFMLPESRSVDKELYQRMIYEVDSIRQKDFFTAVN